VEKSSLIGEKKGLRTLHCVGGRHSKAVFRLKAKTITSPCLEKKENPKETNRSSLENWELELFNFPRGNVESQKFLTRKRVFLSCSSKEESGHLEERKKGRRGSRGNRYRRIAFMAWPGKGARGGCRRRQKADAEKGMASISTEKRGGILAVGLGSPKESLLGGGEERISYCGRAYRGSLSKKNNILIRRGIAHLKESALKKKQSVL